MYVIIKLHYYLFSNLFLQTSNTVFKIEPLLRRNAPSVELSAQVAINLVRASYIASIISREGNITWMKEKLALKQTCQQQLDDCPKVPPKLRKIFLLLIYLLLFNFS